MAFSILRAVAFFTLFLTFAQARAQSEAAPVSQEAAASWPQKTIRFSDEKLISGLPSYSGMRPAHCSADGTVFLDLFADIRNARGRVTEELFSISLDGDTKHVQRARPTDGSGAIAMDFFADEHSVVTLLETTKPKDPNDLKAGFDRSYALAVSDHNGDGAEFLPLHLGFRPMKIALLGSGFLMLGWDEIELSPKLALLKDDGSFYRLIDLEGQAGPPPVYDSRKEALSSPVTRTALRTLQDSSFVPYGKRVLLYERGTTAPVRVLSALGEERHVSLQLPAGFLLSDILVSGDSGPWVVRAQSAQDFATFREKHVLENPHQRIFEVDPLNGTLLREFVFEKPQPASIVCAESGKLTAVFEDRISDTAPPTGSVNDDLDPKEDAQFVIATAPR